MPSSCWKTHARTHSHAQILGLDIMIDEDYELWLLECNAGRKWEVDSCRVEEIDYTQVFVFLHCLRHNSSPSSTEIFAQVLWFEKQTITLWSRLVLPGVVKRAFKGWFQSPFTFIMNWRWGWQTEEQLVRKLSWLLFMLWSSESVLRAIYLSQYNSFWQESVATTVALATRTWSTWRSRETWNHVSTSLPRQA